MTTQPHNKAILLDLHTPFFPSPSNHTHPLAHPSIPYNHLDLPKQISDILFNNRTSRDVTYLYILTSSATDVSRATEDLTPVKEQSHVIVVEGDSRISSFYRAKQKLDLLELSEIVVMCSASVQKFWTYVCQDLFTPVHEWEVEVMPSPLWVEQILTTKANMSKEDKETSPSEPSERDGFNDACLNGIDAGYSAHDFNQGSFTHELNAKSSGSSEHDFRTESSTHDFTTGSPTHNFSSGSSTHDSNTSFSPHDCTPEEVRAETARFLQTLPSLLGLPEVQRSGLLPGEDQGFRHGYSTRRGGVTSLPTLCSMNLMYTDKKRDSRLVVEENRRRLSLVGGFDPTTFHLVRVEHGHRVWTVGEEDPPLKYDALVTNRSDVTIAAAGADCIPLLFADPVKRAIGAAHAGWLGSVERIAECVVKTMEQRFGSQPEDIRVSMGPGLRLGCFKVLKQEGVMFAEIHPSCQADTVEKVNHKVDLTRGKISGWGSYRESPHRQVPHDPENNVEDVPDQQTDDDSSTLIDSSERRETSTDVGNVSYHPGASESKHLLEDLRVEQVPANHLKPKTPKKRRSSRQEWTFVDLQKTNYHVLLQAGVKAEHIDLTTSHCTKCNPDLYFSYERDGFPFGNQIGFICMPSGPRECSALN